MFLNIYVTFGRKNNNEYKTHENYERKHAND
jgi:hypothetical protein